MATPIGLQLRFIKDPSTHYAKDTPEFTANEYYVLGQWDRLTIREVHDLAGFASTGTGDHPEVFHQRRNAEGAEVDHSAMCLNLLLDPWAETRLYEVAAACHKHELVSVVQIGLSSVLLSAESDYEATLGQLRDLHKKLVVRLKDSQYGFSFGEILWSIGNDGFVGLIGLRGESQLFKVMDFVQAVREVKFDDLQTCDEGSNFHAFSYVSATLATRPVRSIDNSEDNANQPRLLVTAAVSVAPGHEQEILPQVQNKDWFYCWGGGASLRVGFKSVGEYLDWILKLRRNESRPSPQDLGPAKAELLFPTTGANQNTQREDTQHNPVEPIEDFVGLFRKVEAAIKNFTTNKVGPSQGTEIAKAVAAVTNAALRNDRMASVRDLVPFLRRLSECLSSEAWVRYIKSDKRRPEFASRELANITEHMWKAIQSRIESRVDQFDPLLSSTLDNGFTKLINAYSVVAFICWDLITHQLKASNTSISSSKIGLETACTADRFAICVCSGSSGRVVWGHALRQFVCDYQPEESSVPLILLDLSGSVIFRPEAAFVHCLHEMAECSEWGVGLVQPDQIDVLRRELSNRYSLMLLGQMLVETRSRVDEFDAKMHNKEITDIQFLTLLRAATVVFFKKQIKLRLAESDTGNANEPHKVAQREKDEIRKNELDRLWSADKLSLLYNIAIADIPLDLLEYYHLDAWHCLSSGQFYEECKVLCPGQGTNYDTIQEALSDAFPSRLVVDELGASFELYSESYSILIRELVADSGMISSLATILHSEGKIADVSDLRSHINYAFVVMLESVANWLSSDMLMQSLDSVVVRWATFHRALYLRDFDYMDWEDAFVKECVSSARRVIKNAGNSFLNNLAIAVKSVLKDNSNFCLYNRAMEEGYVEYGLDDSVSDIFRRFLTSLFDKSDQEWLPATGSPIGKLISEFSEVWTAAALVCSGEIGTSDIEALRSRFIVGLWAKSQKLVFNQIFRY